MNLQRVDNEVVAMAMSVADIIQNNSHDIDYDQDTTIAMLCGLKLQYQENHMCRLSSSDIDIVLEYTTLKAANDAESLKTAICSSVKFQKGGRDQLSLWHTRLSRLHNVMHLAEKNSKQDHDKDHVA